MSEPRIYTLGYSGWKPDAIDQAVRDRHAVLVDVRYKPVSRYFPFHRKSFQDRLVEAYKWVGEFGNLNYHLDISQALIADFETGAKIVEAILAGGQSVILMCGCGDLATCHRKIVAERLAQRTGLPLEHLTPPPRHVELSGLLF